MTDNLIARLRNEGRSWREEVGDMPIFDEAADALEAAELRANAAEREMHARELHHFEAEELLAEAQAVIAQSSTATLEAVKASAWREGHRQALANMAWPKGRKDNPYRAKTEAKQDERMAYAEVIPVTPAEWPAAYSVHEESAMIWVRNNPAQPEAVAYLAELSGRARIRRAREPKRLLIRKASPGLWVVRDQAKPHWLGSRMTHAGIVEMLDVLSRHPERLGEWDGKVRFMVRHPEVDIDDFEYFEEWEF